MFETDRSAAHLQGKSKSANAKGNSTRSRFTEDNRSTALRLPGAPKPNTRLSEIVRAGPRDRKARAPQGVAPGVASHRTSSSPNAGATRPRTDRSQRVV